MARATFPHIRLHQDMADHPKIEPLSDAAFRLLIDGWLWSRKHGTDGLMPTAVWTNRRTAKIRGELVAAGLVVMCDKGARFHSYLDYQASAAELQEKREQAREAGRLGGLARAKRTANHSAKRNATEPLSESLSGSSSGIQAEVEVEVEEEQKTSSSVGRARRATQAPDIFPITDAMKAWGRQHAPLVSDPEGETRQFLDHHRAKGSVFKDWTAAWRTWMGNAQKYALQRGVRPQTQQDPSKAWLENM